MLSHQVEDSTVELVRSRLIPIAIYWQVEVLTEM